MSKTVKKCGFTSLTYGEKPVMTGQLLDVSPSQCRDAIRLGRMKVDGREFAVSAGREEQYTYFSHGNVHPNGACETEDFISGGFSFYGSVKKILR